MALTRSLPFAQWTTALADAATLTAALRDPLRHHAQLVQITGESWRSKDERTARCSRP